MNSILLNYFFNNLVYKSFLKLIDSKMKIYILVFSYLFSSLYSAYLPFKKNSDFGDDLCLYKPHGIYYAKDCKDNKYCQTFGDLGFCKDIPTEITLMNIDSSGSCSSDFQCESNLVCKNSKCTYSSDCPTGSTLYRNNYGSYGCRENKYNNIIYHKDFTWVGDGSGGGAIRDNSEFIVPDFLKVGGKITKFNITNYNTYGSVYEAEEIQSAYVGTIEDGNFVFDETACKSGFALYFYGDGNLKNPYTSYRYNFMYKKCVTLRDIEVLPSQSCKISYSIGENGDILTYNVDKLSGYTITDQRSHYSNPGTNYYTYDLQISKLCDSDLKVKLEIFKKYIGIFTEDFQSKCTKSEKYNGYLETCGDNKLRKWSYLYANPNVYQLYYDEDKDEDGNEVVNYLVQQTYHSYQSAGLLNIKYFIYLLFLLSL